MELSQTILKPDAAEERDSQAANPSSPVVYEAVGTHLLLTLSDCRAELLHDSEGLKDLVQRAAEATGATVLQIVAHRFQPQGTTVVAVLAESHASLHTYPESQTVFFDCFTCGATCRPELSEEILTQALMAGRVSKQVVVRGE